MSGFGSTSQKEGGKASFWKKTSKSLPGSIKPVYGAQHPPRHEPLSEPGTPKKMSKSRDSFKHFQENTNDAWDDGDDDLIATANVRMNIQDIHSTALQVLNNHSQQVQAAKAANAAAAGAASPIDVPQSRLQTDNSGSAPNTPTHSPSQRLNGPGLGVRLHTHARPAKSVPLQFGPLPVSNRESCKADKFKTLLQLPTLDLEEFKKVSWSGIPIQYRPTTWKILSGYLPPSLDRREPTLTRKRQEYFNFIAQYYDTRLQEIHQDTFRQIHIDIPRMSPLIPLFQQEVVQEKSQTRILNSEIGSLITYLTIQNHFILMFERILYIWAMRHPASGYVQGINDLVTPFFVVYLTEYVADESNIDTCELSQLPKENLHALEADCFWCFSKLLDGIQDNYTFAQPGIQQKVMALKDLVGRIDNELHLHLEKQHVEYLQFAFRWMNNLLMREMPLRCVIRLWDTYLSEPNGFAVFHLYVCAAFLTKFSSELKREKDFQGLMLMLQNLPTHHWTNEEIGLILAEAYRLKYMFADAPNHLVQKK